MPAVAIPAAVGLGSSIFSGIMGSRAAKSAANTQYQATQQAQQFLKDLLGQYNPKIGEAADAAATGVVDAGNRAITGMQGALAQNRTNVLGGVEQANKLLEPYLAMGGYGADTAKTLSSMLQPGGDLNRQFSFKDIQELDPGYQFRMDQASKALQSSAAAKGGALGGGALQALSNLNQNLASSEAGNAFARLNQQQQNRFSMLNDFMKTGLSTGYSAATGMGSNIMGANQFLAGEDLSGANTMGNWMIQPAEYAGNMRFGASEAMANNAMDTGRSITDLMTGGANAQAAGKVGSANAWTNMGAGIADTGNQIGRYYQDKELYKQLRNPSVKGVYA